MITISRTEQPGAAHTAIAKNAWCLWLVGLMLSALIPTAIADTPKSSPEKGVPAQQQSAGQNTPSASFSSDPSKVTMEKLKDGTELYHFNGQNVETIKVRRNAQGKREFFCTDHLGSTLTDRSRKGDSHAH